MAAAAERRRQFDAGGMRGVGSEIELNPDRGAAVAESAEGAALVNPDAGYTVLSPDLNVAGPPYQPDEGAALVNQDAGYTVLSHDFNVAGPPYQLDEGADEEKDEEPQQEAKSSGGFGRIRKAVGDFFVGSMSPGRRPTARVVPAVAERAMRHRRDIELAFAPPDRGEMQADYVPMPAISSSRNLQAGADREQRYNETLQLMQGRDPFDLPISTVTSMARGLGIVVTRTMSKWDIAVKVQQVLDRKT
jgi:hypothetical protein